MSSAAPPKQDKHIPILSQSLAQIAKRQWRKLCAGVSRYLTRGWTRFVAMYSELMQIK